MAIMRRKTSIFSPIRLSVIASLGVLMFLVNLGTGTLIVQATGIPVAGGFVMFFLFSVIAVFTRLVLGRFGAATLASLVFGALGLAAPILGPPGFLPKLAITVALGLTIDLAFQVFRNEKISSIVGGILACYLGLGVIFLIFKFFLPPQPFSAFSKLIPYFLAINWLEGLLGGLIGLSVYNKLKKRAVIARIQGA